MLFMLILSLVLCWYVPKRFGSWKNFLLWEE
jgi:hypothetical protein